MTDKTKELLAERNRIICGDCLKILPLLSKATMIFADPPDNLGIKYEGFMDNWPSDLGYLDWLCRVTDAALDKSLIFWLSYNARWTAGLVHQLQSRHIPWQHLCSLRLFIWRFTFGQHNQNDCGNGFRPLLRFKSTDDNAILYPDAIREPSARQTKYNDKRANPEGRVPDDVWEFPRVCGTFKERKKWHPCQHPKALLRRIVLFSTKPGDLVIDMFAGSGNLIEVCRETDRQFIGIDISRFYCEQIAKEQDIKVICPALIAKELAKEHGGK